MIDKKTLNDALEYACFPSPPDLNDESRIWIKAIVLIKKINNISNYGIAKRDEYGKIRIIKDFGPSVKIIGIEDLRPYCYLKPKYIGEFKNKTDIINYLVSNNPDLSIDKLSLMKGSDLKRMVINNAIEQQLKTEE